MYTACFFGNNQAAKVATDGPLMLPPSLGPPCAASPCTVDLVLPYRASARQRCARVFTSPYTGSPLQVDRVLVGTAQTLI